MRLIGCIGNNWFIFRREFLSLEEFKRVIFEFRKMGGKEFWLINYDSIEFLMVLVNFVFEIEIFEVYVVVRFEDILKIMLVEEICFIVEIKYFDVGLEELFGYLWFYGVLVVVDLDYLEDVIRESFLGELYVDVLYLGFVKKISFNIIEVRCILNLIMEEYYDCFVGIVVVMVDGYVLLCLLFRNYIVGDLKKESFRKVICRKCFRVF